MNGYKSMAEVVYAGITPDMEVPNDLVVASPGGVSSTHHHWTGGIYGTGNTSSDYWGGSNNRYNEGIYANLYEKGFDASEKQKLYGASPTDPAYFDNMSGFELLKQYENFEQVDIPPQNITVHETVQSNSLTPSTNSAVLFILFLLAYLAFNLFGESLRTYMKDVFFKGKKIDWKQFMATSILLTIIFVLGCWLNGVPITQFESPALKRAQGK